MKLKKLILSGFKSFAEKTAFEFDDGINCVVGPNGCGKSNLVDAVKWVLGEQSAKSLRGSQMADVIFNGSSARKACGSAQVTLVFDNTSGRLKPAGRSGDIPANGQVSVTRRLFRSGVSEYLVNKTPCRLKDIREMLMGTGADAYSVIEQGRIGAFLQASRDERRVIFDEAAGISMYKARKKEALRKLERVEQNLLRLNDIIGEVDKRLRSIKHQAGRARSYRTYMSRLNELKSLHFLCQYHKFIVRREELDRALETGRTRLAEENHSLESLRQEQRSTESRSRELGQQCEDLHRRLSGIASDISTRRQRAEMLDARAEELRQQITTADKRCAEFQAQIESGNQEIENRRQLLEKLDNDKKRMAQSHQAVNDEYQQVLKAIESLQNELEDEKTGTIDLLRRTAHLHNEINASAIKRENLSGQKDRLSRRADEISRDLGDLLRQKAEIQEKLQEISEVAAASDEKVQASRNDAQQAIRAEDELNRRQAQLREQSSAINSRIETISEMLSRLEGLGTGTRAVLRARSEGRLDDVLGMIGDFIQTDTKHALQVQAALGSAEEYLVVPSAEKLNNMLRDGGELQRIITSSGPVKFLCLDMLPAFCDDLDAASYPQVICRMIDVVRTESGMSRAAWALLGKTLLVRNLDDAMTARRALGAGYRFVTQSGEVLRADGSVRAGSPGAASEAGVVARRSELAELKSRSGQLKKELSEMETTRGEVSRRRRHCEKLIHSLRTAVYEANTERLDYRNKLDELNRRIEQLQKEQPLVGNDIEALGREIEHQVHREHNARAKARELEQINAEHKTNTERLNKQIAAAQQRRDELSSRLTECKVALASAEEKRASAESAIEQLTAERRRMEHDLEASRTQIRQDRQRLEESRVAATQARNEADDLAHQRQTLGEDLSKMQQQRQEIRGRLEQIAGELERHRQSVQGINEEINTLRVENSQIQAHLEDLVSRAIEEMDMDLGELYKNYSHDEERDWSAVEAEIAELRGKVSRLGNVNLDAISEQEQLQKRREFLASQLEDVRNSQNGILQLIRRLNEESRRLFTETFDKVRENFQQLFRKLFGGGRADIFLTDPEDVLESHIEIVARPPGKELRSLTLLSGGEKSMTALALLFSIFKARPSPFCVLDEVDAALDEANNTRFVRLLKEFAQSTQFIVISHAKRTIGTAGVLYGVTMLQAGVSKRISVRFQDVHKHVTPTAGTYQSDTPSGVETERRARA